MTKKEQQRRHHSVHFWSKALDTLRDFLIFEYLEQLKFYSELTASGKSSNTFLLSAGTQHFWSSEPDNPVETLSLSALLIVSRYSTVVVLEVVVVVVVLEVVSASSQQHPVSQTVSPVVVVQ